MKLPQLKTEGTVSVEQAIQQRRTVRAYRPQALNIDQLSQLFWAAQGITESMGDKRAAPSARATYPVDVYAVTGKEMVIQLEAGVYHYEPKGHLLSMITEQDLRDRVARAAASQMWMAQAPINFVITAEYSRAAGRIGRRGRNVMIEAGHIGQNIYLQAEALGLKAGIVGAFRGKELVHVMNISHKHKPVLIMPVGYAA